MTMILVKYSQDKIHAKMHKNDIFLQLQPLVILKNILGSLK